jgi:hypothetical protein
MIFRDIHRFFSEKILFAVKSRDQRSMDGRSIDAERLSAVDSSCHNIVKFQILSRNNPENSDAKKPTAIYRADSDWRLDQEFGRSFKFPSLSIAPSAKESFKTGACPAPFSLRDGVPPNEF